MALAAQVDTARNLLYIRGQVPGPTGRSVLLRDSRLVRPSQRGAWGLPFPTNLEAAAQPGPLLNDTRSEPSAASSAKDPYREYQAETDYFPISWKKGD